MDVIYKPLEILINKILKSFLILSSVAIFPTTVYASTDRLPTEAERQVMARQQQQQIDLNNEIYAQQVADTNVRLETEKLSSLHFPQNESPCFPIHQLVLNDFHRNETHSPQTSRFDWALKAVYAEQNLTLPACLGSEGINVLLRYLQNQLIDAGYVTTRVLVSPQDLSSGKLVLTVIPGTVGQIRLQDHSVIPFATRGTRWFAMPMAQGELLNVRDLEQGLENLKRPPSADATIELVPSDNIGETDILIHYQQRLPLHLTLSLDDAGTKATGRLQGSATFSWDNMLTLNDMFYISGTRSFKRSSDHATGDYGSENIGLYYAIAWKNYLLTLSGSRYTYHQTIAGAFESYQYSGKSQQMKATLSRLFSRGTHYKTYLYAGVWARRSSNAINDTEIQVQRRRTAGWEVGVNHTHYFNAITLQLGLNYKRGTGAYKALPAPEEQFNEGTSRMKIVTASADLSYPFMIGNQAFRFNTNWHAQWNRTPLVQQDRLSIGGRYTVRGFDGELMLSGERGWVWRNELSWNVMNTGHELYMGIDQGVVKSNQETLQVGSRLTGGVIGLRGQFKGLQYEYFVGTPIKKPKGFRTSHVTTGFQLSYRF